MNDASDAQLECQDVIATHKCLSGIGSASESVQDSVSSCGLSLPDSDGAGNFNV